MTNFIKIYWIPLTVMFVLFFDELFNCSAIVLGFTVESGIKQYEAILLSAIGFSMMGYDLLKGRIKKREHHILDVLFVLLFLYMLTPLFYGRPSANYTASLLVYGSECIPAAYIGIRFAKSGSFQRLNDLLPFFVIPVSILIGTIGMTAAMMGTIVTESEEDGVGVDAGLNYQILSYFMAFSYTYASYYVFYCNHNSGIKNVILRLAMAADMFFCAAICLISGGRGGFVYIVAITLFLLFYYLKSSKKNRVHAIFIIAILTIISLYAFMSLDILQSAGMGRVMEKLTEDDGRKDLYLSAFDAFLTSPIIGMGVGSIWWTVGYFCHNMILDLLAETGLIGTIFFLSIVWRSFFTLYRLSNINKIYLFLLLVMTGNLMNLFFSGYYFNAFKLFFVCSLSFCLPIQKIKK